MKISEFLDRYYFVRKCGGCREILEYERSHEAFCPSCALAWSVAKTGSCPECSQSAIECTCMPRGLSSAGALCLRKLFFYSAKKDREAQNRIIYLLKKNPNRRISRFIARELESMMIHELEVLGARESAVIVSVPRGRRARSVWGFDQSELICRELSDISGIPYVSAIKRRFGGKEQKKLSRAKRFRNIRSLFALSSDTSIDGRYVILFDDVVTTGASMAACVSLLMSAGARGVICLCIAQN